MAVDATLLARDRWVDRAEHQLVTHVQETRLGLQAGLAREGLDRLGHLGVHRWSLDLSARATDPDQPEHVVALADLVEELDRMRSERRRYRRIRRVEFRPLIRISGDESVDELESGNFLLALAGGECAEAELIDAVADAGR